jgi:hypothetical protein
MASTPADEGALSHDSAPNVALDEGALRTCELFRVCAWLRSPRNLNPSDSKCWRLDDGLYAHPPPRWEVAEPRFCAKRGSRRRCAAKLRALVVVRARVLTPLSPPTLQQLEVLARRSRRSTLSGPLTCLRSPHYPQLQRLETRWRAHLES